MTVVFQQIPMISNIAIAALLGISLYFIYKDIRMMTTMINDLREEFMVLKLGGGDLDDDESVVSEDVAEEEEEETDDDCELVCTPDGAGCVTCPESPVASSSGRTDGELLAFEDDEEVAADDDDDAEEVVEELVEELVEEAAEPELTA